MIKQRYAYIAALLTVILISLQSGITGGNNAINLDLDATVFYSINYLFWATIIPLVNRIIRLDYSSYRSFLLAVLMSIVLIIFHYLITNVIYFFAKQVYDTVSITDFMSISSDYLLESIFRRLIDISFIILILKVIDNYMLAQERKAQMESLETQLAEVKFEALKSQLNPHFLFNALHSVYTLIGYEDERAKKMVIKFSDLLRTMLNDSKSQYSTLAEEIKYINDYLAIEKERFNDRLNIEEYIDEESKQIEVPRFLLQPLVENAIKHGIAHLEDGGTIILKSEMDGNDLKLTVKNPISQESEKSTSLGIGLTNLKERIQTIDPDHSIKTSIRESEFEVNILLKGSTQ